MRLEIRQGNVFTELPKIESNSIDLCITSPPYWGLRSYGTQPQVFGGKPDCKHEFREFAEEEIKSFAEISIRGTCRFCGAWRGELGEEPTIEIYLDNLMKWVKEVWRVLKPSGSFVLNIGDCFFAKLKEKAREQVKNSLGYVQRKSGFSVEHGFYKTKQFLSVSSFAYYRIVSETDFVCRGEHIWCKPNVPNPIRSRLKHSHEKLFWFVKDAKKYYFDAKPWLKKVKEASHNRGKYLINMEYFNSRAQDKAKALIKIPQETIEHSWRIVPVGAKQSGFELLGRQASEHIAPFPEALIKPYILSLCPPDGVVLDPFLGSGTTMRVAMEAGRSAVGIELNAKYIEYAKKRLNWGAGLGVEYIEFGGVS